MALEDFIYSLKWFFSNLFEKLFTALKNLNLSKRTRVALICTLVFLIVIPFAIILTAKITFSIDSKKEAPAKGFVPSPIAAEDLFIPAKPDFLPPVMLEQRQKNIWTNEGAREFWTSPSEFPDEFWQGKISASIDRLLESMP
ncbi:MAG: hypothetical protein LBC27_01705 [Spirochaetaceae bacterium]|jgi:hypothetical protein|nr:hypothetical protein [Spirochaetaceae bacterium]